MAADTSNLSRLPSLVRVMAEPEISSTSYSGPPESDSCTIILQTGQSLTHPVDPTGFHVTYGMSEVQEKRSLPDKLDNIIGHSSEAPASNSSAAKTRANVEATSGSSLNLEFARINRHKQFRKPEKPKLQFILPNSKGSQDHDNPVAGEVFKSSTLGSFFSLVCNRGSQPCDSVECLTFRYNWGSREAFTVEKNLNDEIWEELKERVRDTFKNDREKFCKRAKWQIWIELGDTTNLEDEEEEDDW